MDQSQLSKRTENRLELHELLVEALGSRNVYFQPPENVKLIYPCIVYSRSTPRDRFANNDRYLSRDRFSITVIDRDPDSIIPDKVMMLPLSSIDRTFVSDSLNHTVLDLYF